MGHIQATGFYMIHQWYAVNNFTATTYNDTQINLAWSIIQANMTGLFVEQSTDGINYSLIDFIGGSETSYNVTGLTTNIHYWFRIRGIKSETYSEYCTPDDDWTAWKFTVEKTGDGTGRATCTFGTITENIYATIDGNGLFYAGPTGGVGDTTWNMTVGSISKFIEVTSGTSTILIFHKNNIINWGTSTTPGGASTGWSASGANQPKINLTTAGLVRSLQTFALGVYGTSGGVITGTWADLPSGLTQLYLNGSGCNITGSPADLPSGIWNLSIISGGALIGNCNLLPVGLRYIYIVSSTGNISGDVSGFPSTLEYIGLISGVSVSGNVTGFPQNELLYNIYIGGSNTISGDISELDYSGCAITLFHIFGSNTITGNISGMPDCIQNLNIGGNNTLSGDVSGFPQVGTLQSISIAGNNMITGAVSGLDYSGCVLIYFSLTGNNTVSGNISGLPSTLTTTNITGANVIDGNIGDCPTSGGLTIMGGNTITGDIADIPNNTYTAIQIYGSNTIFGSIANLPTIKTSSLTVQGSNTINGNIEDLPVNLTSLNIAGQNTIGGNLNNLPSDTALSILQILGYNTITGDLASFPSTIRQIDLHGYNTVYGDIADLPVQSMTLIFLEGENAVTDYTSPSGGLTWNALVNWSSPGISILPCSTGGIPQAKIDDLLTDLDNSWTGTRAINVDLRGSNEPPSSAMAGVIASIDAKISNIYTN